MKFQLHKDLERDCIPLGRLQLCRLLLMNNKRYPWFILVPEAPDITEIYQLSKAQQIRLIEESCYLAGQLNIIYKADKMNIAAIGNVVPQLHLHHIVRYRTDGAWPAPVWGKLPAIPYSESEIAETIKLISGNVKLVHT